MTSPPPSERTALPRLTLLADEQLPLLPVNRFPGTLIDPDTLPISPDLLARIKRWSDDYYAEDGELPPKFWKDAATLRDLLAAELNGLYLVKLADHHAEPPQP